VTTVDVPSATTLPDGAPVPFDVPTPTQIDVPTVGIDRPNPIGFDVPPREDGGQIFSPVGTWRLTSFRFIMMGSETVITDQNRSIPADPTGRYRVNGTLDVALDHVAFAWGVLRSDHFFVANPMIDVDNGYSGTAFYLDGTLDIATGRFSAGAFSLELFATSNNVVTLRSMRDGWVATFNRDPLQALPLGATMNFEGSAQQIAAEVSDPFVQPRVALLWDRPGSNDWIETNGANFVFNAGVFGGYRMALTTVPPGAFGTVDGVRVAYAYITVYDDVDRNGMFNSSMVGGVGPDVPRGVSPIAIAVRDGAGVGGDVFAESPFRLLRIGWQFVNIERDSNPQPAVLVPYAMTNPVRPDVPVSETPQRRRFLDLLPGL
jgi:hypothetical protein